MGDYKTRRIMLLKRCDVTIASFKWSDRAKAKMKEITAMHSEQRQKLYPEPTVTVAHLLAAREDLSQMTKTSSGDSRHACEVNQFRMGQVPDRGGRTAGTEGPPPEMPSWQKRQNSGQNNYRGGNNNRGYRGGNNQRSGNNYNGGNSQRGGNNYRGGYNQRGGNNRNGGNRGGYGVGNNEAQGGERSFYSNNQSGRGGQSRYSGRGNLNTGNGHFERTFGNSGQGRGRGGFGGGRNQYSS